MDRDRSARSSHDRSFVILIPYIIHILINKNINIHNYMIIFIKRDRSPLITISRDNFIFIQRTNYEALGKFRHTIIHGYVSC